MDCDVATAAETRAKLSLGISGVATYRMVADALAGRHKGGGILLDLGCGHGDLWPFVADHFAQYTGADVLRYDGFPKECEFRLVDLDTGQIPYPDEFADVVVAVETIEHLENPRAFARELTRLVKPGGWAVVTTPNQLSLLSKLGLLVKNEFPAFRGINYPAHLSALLEVDLRRIAAECGWEAVAVHYTGSGRLPGTSRHWPSWISRSFPRSLSDNVMIVGRKNSN
jgi:SAM-dependent methyltransferase